MRYAKEVFTNLPQRVIGEGVWWWAVSTAGNRFSSPLDYDSSLFFDNELEAQVWCANNPGSNLYRKTGAYLIWERINV